MECMILLKPSSPCERTTDYTRFRWAVSQLDAIRDYKKISLLKKTLKSLPKTLDETYERILASIPDEYVENVQRVVLFDLFFLPS